MSTIWNPNTDLCRCCHAEGSFCNLSEAIVHNGRKEVYVDMLKDCFDVELCPVEGMPYVMTICDDCIVRLRDANNFKQQVLTCEKEFQELTARYRAELQSVQVKEEVVIEVKQEVLDTDENEANYVVNISDSDDEDQPILKKLLIKYPKQEKTKKAAAKRKVNQKTKKPQKKKATKGKGRNESETKDSEDEKGDSEDESRDIKDETRDSEDEMRNSDDEIVDSKDDDADSEPPVKKKKGVARRNPKFVLKESDYRQDGAALVCAHCDKRYDKLFSLRFHLKSKHYKICRYFCQLCGEGFLTQAPLTVHKLQQHGVDDRFKCKACPAAFNTSIQLRKHVNNYHMLGQKYKCDSCDYESFSFEGLYKHKFKHKTVKDYHCKFCRKSFLRKATLDLHERIHTGDRRKVCQVCSQAFVQKASLNYHMTKYHPEVNF